MSRRTAPAGIEYRFTRASAPTVDDEGKLTGLAAPFGTWTMIGEAPWGFRERIAPGAFKKALNDGDTVLLDNHDPSRPIARKSAGTLELRETARGLEYVATPANTTYARDLVENVRAKNIKGNSFGFRAVADRWAVGDDGVDERELLEVKLPEVSPCTFPAYETTEIGVRDACDAAREAALARRGISPAELRGAGDDAITSRFHYLMWLREKYSSDDKKAMLKKGHAFKNANGDASYPIEDEEDLGKAIKAVGRGGADHDAIRKYVIGRAKALGLSANIPGTWNSDGSLKETNSARPGEQRMPTAPYKAHAGEDASCPQCGSANDTDSYFCDQCGAKITGTPGDSGADEDESQQCQSCLSQVSTDAKFCDQCGTGVAGVTPYRKPGGEYSWDRSARAAAHGAFTGKHKHAHPAFGSQGGDDAHAHEHSHDGDAKHDHHSGDNVASEENSEPVTSTREHDDSDLARRMRAGLLAARMRRERSDAELATTSDVGGTGHAGDDGDRAGHSAEAGQHL
jgi:HK97 family phage prohead protease